MGEWNVWFKQEPNTLAPSTSTMATECFDSEVAAQTLLSVAHSERYVYQGGMPDREVRDTA